jgi:hypothetical protein
MLGVGDGAERPGRDRVTREDNELELHGHGRFPQPLYHGLSESTGTKRSDTAQSSAQDRSVQRPDRALPLRAVEGTVGRIKMINRQI